MSDGAGPYLEDFRLGAVLTHPVPRTVSEGDAALYLALTGSRWPLFCCRPFAHTLGLAACPIDDLLLFHLVFGRTVPEVSVNAIANLGYAEGRWRAFVYPGETVWARSEVIGLRETSNRKAGIVWVRTSAHKDDGVPVLDYVRWVMVPKRDPSRPIAETRVPALASSVSARDLGPPSDLGPVAIDPEITGSTRAFEDYAVGERIDHVDGMTVMESEHRLATRLYQNPARVHFDAHRQRKGPHGRCIVYGGVVLSLARALSQRGLENALCLLAINGGTHAHPCFAGDTVYAYSEVLEKAELAERPDVGALRLRLVALKDREAAGFPLRDAEGRYLPEVLLDFDYWLLMPRRCALGG